MARLNTQAQGQDPGMTDTERKPMDDGGSAFPVAFPVKDHFSRPGMSLRDWFAGMALQGMAANSAALDLIGRGAQAAQISSAEYMANGAYELADAMLRAKSGSK